MPSRLILDRPHPFLFRLALPLLAVAAWALLCLAVLAAETKGPWAVTDTAGPPLTITTGPPPAAAPAPARPAWRPLANRGRPVLRRAAGACRSGRCP